MSDTRVTEPRAPTEEECETLRRIGQSLLNIAVQNGSNPLIFNLYQRIDEIRRNLTGQED